MSFTHLHVHSNYSFCRGAATIDNLCRKAGELNYTHLALTDTNGLYGMGWFLAAARAHHLQPIIGASLISDRQRAVMLAKNERGYQNLCRTITEIHYNSHLDLAACIVKNAPETVIFSDDLGFLQQVIKLGAPVNLYAELVAYRDSQKVLQFARASSLPLVATNQVYMVDEGEYAIHRLLRAIDLNTTLERLPADELARREAVLNSESEMALFFPHCPEALENAHSIARQCSFNIDFLDFIFPAFEQSNSVNPDTELLRQVREGIKWRYGATNEKIEKRLEYELDIIIQKKFAPYFLVVADIVRQAPRTCGRGSAAASLVSYCLGITHVDPIKYNLFFERFLNMGRQDPPDIDVDFPWDERDDILNYIFTHYGAEHAAMVANHCCFQPRSAIREIAKVYGMPAQEIDIVTRRMGGYWQPADIWQYTQTHPLYRATEIKEPWPEIIALADKIRDYPRYLSIHCGGVVIVPDSLDHYVPTQPAKKMLKLTGIIDSDSSGLPSHYSPEQVRVIQWEKDQTEEMKLVKMDILGNRSLAVIRDALRAVKANYGIQIDYASWNPLEDDKTQEMLKNGDTIGVFYVESPAMRLLQQKTQRGDFEHLVIHSSIIRPAANTYINEYVRRLKGGQYEPLHPILEELLQETYGIMVYQEDVSRVAMILADFDAAEADNLRKIMAKKHKQQQIEDYREKFFSGARAKGVSEEICTKIWDMILSFSGYSFCKPHSASYAQVSFKSAYLRVYYPAEFMAAVISNQGGYYSPFAYISESRRMGLQIKMPDINCSEWHYVGENRSIRVGIMQLKGINRDAMIDVLKERKEKGAFTSFHHFLQRAKLDAADIAILIKAGCFDELEARQTRPQLLWQLKSYFAVTQSDRKKGTLSLFEMEASPHLPQPPAFDEETTLQQEVEALGFLISRHPLTLYRSRLDKLSYIEGKDFKNHIGKRITAIGWFVTGKVTSTRQEQMMEFISFEDTTAIYETTFFPKTYDRFIHMVSGDRPLLLRGKVEIELGAITLAVEQVEYV